MRLQQTLLLLLALVLLFLVPMLCLYAAVGVLGGAAIAAAFLFARRHRRKVLKVSGLVLGGLAVVLVLSALMIPSLMQMRDAARPRLQVLYEGLVELDEVHHRWQIQDQIEINIPDREAIQLEMEEGVGLEQIAQMFVDAGWHPLDAPSTRMRFVQHRAQPLESRWYKTCTHNDIALPQLDELIDLPGLDFRPSSDSQIAFRTSTPAIPRSEPEAIHRSQLPSGGYLVAVPCRWRYLPESESGKFVRLDVLHPWLRMGPLLFLRRISEFGMVHWLIAGLFGTFHDHVRGRLIQPIWDPLRSWLDRRWPSSEPGSPGPPRKKKRLARRDKPHTVPRRHAYLFTKLGYGRLPKTTAPPAKPAEPRRAA